MGPELGAKDAAERSNRGGGGDDARGELGVGIALERRAFGVDVDADDVRAAREGKSRGGATGLSAGFGSGERAGRFERFARTSDGARAHSRGCVRRTRRGGARRAASGRTRGRPRGQSCPEDRRWDGRGRRTSTACGRRRRGGERGEPARRDRARTRRAGAASTRRERRSRGARESAGERALSELAPPDTGRSSPSPSAW